MSDPDIVAQLRGWSQGYQMDEAVRDMRDAADEIERLRARVAELEGAQ